MSPAQFSALIAAALEQQPELLQHALSGITLGMERVLRIQREHTALADQATLAVMALSKGRLGNDLRETLLARVSAAIHPVNQCGYERGYIDHYRAATESQQP